MEEKHTPLDKILSVWERHNCHHLDYRIQTIPSERRRGIAPFASQTALDQTANSWRPWSLVRRHGATGGCAQRAEDEGRRERISLPNSRAQTGLREARLG